MRSRSVFLKIPVPPRQQVGGEGRPLSEIARQPRFIVAVACGVASYSMMNMVMTAAPLAMVMCNHSIGDATLGLQWHVLGMFVPSFFTGNLIVRFGAERVVAAGLGVAGAERDRRDFRHFRCPLLDRPRSVGSGLELWLHRRDHDGDGVPHAQ